VRDRPLIAAGVVVALAVITWPFWHALSARTTAKGPEPTLPVSERQCVAPTAFMRTSHMDLLVQWREQVVRNGATTYVAGNGHHYSMSLSKTCLDCHKSKADFCDKCHNYAAVSPPCWDCHVDPRAPGVRAPQLASRWPQAAGGGER
jgi:hypothetical protein